MDINLALFHVLAAGHAPSPWLLPAAKLLAVYGPWLVVAVMGWEAWHRPALRPYLMLLVVMASATSIVSHAIAQALHMQRPFMLGLGAQYVAHSGSGAMPSTHAAVMSMLTLGFALRPELRRWWPVLAVATLATGWGRIYVNVHFPLDVLGGILLGSALMLLTAMLLHWFAAHRATRRQSPTRPGVRQGAD